MLELIFQGFMEWAYGLTLECWQYFSSSLLDIMSMDFAYLKTHVPVIDDIMQVLMAVGWALLIGNLVFQALKSMASGLGFEGEDPKLLFTRTFVFSFLLLASPQICDIGLSMTSKIIDLLQIPDAVNVQLVDESVFGSLTAAWLLVIIRSRAHLNRRRTSRPAHNRELRSRPLRRVQPIRAIPHRRATSRQPRRNIQQVPLIRQARRWGNLRPEAQQIERHPFLLARAEPRPM